MKVEAVEYRMYDSACVIVKLEEGDARFKDPQLVNLAAGHINFPSLDPRLNVLQHVGPFLQPDFPVSPIVSGKVEKLEDGRAKITMYHEPLPF